MVAYATGLLHRHTAKSNMQAAARRPSARLARGPLYIAKSSPNLESTLTQYSYIKDMVFKNHLIALF